MDTNIIARIKFSTICNFGYPLGGLTHISRRLEEIAIPQIQGGGGKMHP